MLPLANVDHIGQQVQSTCGIFVIFSQSLSANCQGLFQLSTGGAILAQIVQDIAQIVQGPSRIIMAISQHLLANGRRLLIGFSGKRQFALAFINQADVVDRLRGIGVVDSQHLLANGEGLLIFRMGLGKFAFFPQIQAVVMQTGRLVEQLVILALVHGRQQRHQGQERYRGHSPEKFARHETCSEGNKVEAIRRL